MMAIYTMRNLREKLKSLNKNLIETPTQILIDLGYNEHFDARYLTSKYRSLVCTDILFYDNGDLDYEWMQEIINIVLTTFDYKYKKLKQTIDYDYEYDKNYNRTRTETTTDTMGERVSNATTGQQKTTINNGEKTITDTHLEMSYDSTPTGDFTKNRQDVSDSGASVDTSTTDARTDTSTMQSYIDTHVVKEEEYGDLSVRTVAETLERERKIAYFSIWDEIYKDIMKELSDGYFYL